MTTETKKAIKEALLEILFVVFIAATVLFLSLNSCERTIAKECRSCDAPESWCSAYWAHHNLCKETAHGK
jgi:hypothetical protein